MIGRSRRAQIHLVGICDVYGLHHHTICVTRFAESDAERILIVQIENITALEIREGDDAHTSGPLIDRIGTRCQNDLFVAREITLEIWRILVRQIRINEFDSVDSVATVIVDRRSRILQSATVCNGEDREENDGLCE
ncbi:hypothetical protein NY2A_b100L [Paramecium bursaria Chlorella virus NY2A]|uniref:Uncharacterized protein b100L n=1 Tax=Paramecium bursaria Chlorella virus NY2A TaxID=46021 RepID=A7IVX5_PBCVN|nr:hypothetical protein NY2A_b100L [Paramecium bursaria Chlorella virus NY2A]ABT14499.1 hypothetical protein NY2A_b100L [Paramecium bursaria Chlorella virus NY2A]